MSIMEHKESYERFYHGIKKTMSHMKELAALTENKDWLDVAAGLNKILVNGKKFYESKPLTHQQAVQMTDARATEAKGDSVQ